MTRHSRNKKNINYSYFQHFDDDEDFACVRVPPSKKARVSIREQERGRTNAKPTLADHRQSLSVGDKSNESHLESVLQSPRLQTAEAGEEFPSLDKRLDKITDESESTTAHSQQRHGASKATEEQSRALREERDGVAENGGDEDYQPNCTPDSESDADFSEDEEFTVKNGGKTKTIKRETTASPPTTKKEWKPSKPPKSKLQTPGSSSTLTPIASYNVGSVKSASALKKPPATALRREGPISPAGGRLPKWTPPAHIGRSLGVQHSAQVKSPGQGLRLGLSRLVRVKSLHPSVAL